MSHRPLRTYKDAAEIRARLAVLREKADRIVAYNASCEAGTPDIELLDEKQRQKLVEIRRKPGDKFPFLHTIGQAMDIHKGQLHSILQRERQSVRTESAS